MLSRLSTDRNKNKNKEKAKVETEIDKIFPRILDIPKGLTDPETIRRFDHFARWLCPNCGTYDEFLEGPCGGLSQNIKCANCDTKYNIAIAPALAPTGVVGSYHTPVEAKPYLMMMDLI